MTCPAATGPCTVAADGACAVPKDTEALTALENLTIISNSTSFTITWDTPISYPDQTVRILYRDEGGSVYKPMVTAPRDDGTITTANDLTEGARYTGWIRAEAEGVYGPWFNATAILARTELDFSAPSNSFYIGVI